MRLSKRWRGLCSSCSRCSRIYHSEKNSYAQAFVSVVHVSVSPACRLVDEQDEQLIMVEEKVGSRNGVECLKRSAS